jgi:predicted ArsR family transcriptional regulator
MALDELCNAAGLDEAAVRQGLRDLMASGDVERLRPLGWAGEDLDYFRLSRQQDPASSWRFHEAGKTYRAA